MPLLYPNSLFIIVDEQTVLSWSRFNFSLRCFFHSLNTWH